MSCWVVPVVAAELWGVAVETVLENARTGRVPTKFENGFTFIDVAPHSERCDPPRGLRGPLPPTYAVVSGAEIAALTAEPDEPISPPPAVDDWRAARQFAARSRRAPSKFD